MFDGIPLSIADLSGWGVVALLVVMLLTGKGIATRREVEAEKTRADTWQDAWSAERARNDIAFEQLGELLEASRTSAKILDVLHAAARGGDGP